MIIHQKSNMLLPSHRISTSHHCSWNTDSPSFLPVTPLLSLPPELVFFVFVVCWENCQTCVPMTTSIQHWKQGLSRSNEMHVRVYVCVCVCVREWKKCTHNVGVAVTGKTQKKLWHEYKMYVWVQSLWPCTQRQTPSYALVCVHAYYLTSTSCAQKAQCKSIFLTLGRHFYSIASHKSYI